MNNTNGSQVGQSSKNTLLILVIFFALVALVLGLLFLQNTKSLNNEIARLESTQIPQDTYDNYDDCVQNGGKNLATINGFFSACLGGKHIGSEDSYEAYLQYSAQDLPRITERKRTETENVVEFNGSHSTDLVSYLRHDYTGCDISDPTNDNKGYFKVLSEVENRFALLDYGCTNDQSFLGGRNKIIAMKLGDGWSLLSPTGSFNKEHKPSCLLVDMFKISKELTPKCYENTGYNNGDLKDVVHP